MGGIVAAVTGFFEGATAATALTAGAETAAAIGAGAVGTAGAAAAGAGAVGAGVGGAALTAAGSLGAAGLAAAGAPGAASAAPASGINTTNALLAASAATGLYAATRKPDVPGMPASPKRYAVDEDARNLARRREYAAIQQRGGRQASILTAATDSDRLGG